MAQQQRGAADAHAEMIHIVGLYKCGTTWLLHMLAAHPEVIAWREFDPTAAAFTADRRLLPLLRTLRDYLLRRPTAEWVTRREALLPRSADEVFREMFLGRGWLPVMGSQRQAAAARLDSQDLAAMLDELLALADMRLRPADAPLLDPAEESGVIGVQRFRRPDLLELMEAVRDSRDCASAPRLFYDSLRRQVAPGTRIACKAADQVMRLGRLRAASPGARCVAIVRDARDAAISARHYERLMRQREAPWRVGTTSSLRRLLGWSVRAAKLAAHQRRGELLIVRYEDLQADFEGSCQALLDALDLSCDPAIIARIRSATEFSTMAGKSPPAPGGERVVRRGLVGEWREAMSSSEARLAWRLIGRELEAFGYTPEGVLRSSPLVLGGGSTQS
jgi:hypothetical protein